MNNPPIFHHRKTIRLQQYDYTRPGAYFITVCLHDRKQYLFGEIADNVMVLNSVGEYARECWLDIPTFYPYVKLDEFVIMPNHVHGILILNSNNIELGAANQFQQCTSGSIGSIIRGFKVGVTKRLRSINVQTLIWQRNYYEHVIRNEKSFTDIRQYIRDNPASWGNDEENHCSAQTKKDI
jgi:REP element-mobilizing transposase RayT